MWQENLREARWWSYFFSSNCKQLACSKQASTCMSLCAAAVRQANKRKRPEDEEEDVDDDEDDDDEEDDFDDEDE